MSGNGSDAFLYHLSACLKARGEGTPTLKASKLAVGYGIAPTSQIGVVRKVLVSRGPSYTLGGSRRPLHRSPKQE